MSNVAKLRALTRGNVTTNEKTRGAELIEVLEQLQAGEEVFFKYVSSVADVMNQRFKPLTIDDRVRRAWERFDDEALLDIPAVVTDEVDEHGVPIPEYVGILPKLEVAVHLSQFAGTMSEEQSDERTLKSSIGTFVKRKVRRLTRETPIAEAVQDLLNDKVEALGVVDEKGIFIGAFGMHEVFRCFRTLESMRRARNIQEYGGLRVVDLLRTQGGQPSDVTLGTMLGRVRDVMTEGVAKVSTEERIGNACRLMEERSIRYLCVLDQRDRFKGIATDITLQQALPAPKNHAPHLVTDGAMFVYRQDCAQTRGVLNERVGAAMHAGMTCASPDDSLVKAIDLLAKSKAGILPVVEGDGPTIRGVLTRRDVLRTFLALSELATKRG